MTDIDLSALAAARDGSQLYLDTAQDDVYWLAANLAASRNHRPALPSRR